jgi:UDP-N-acetylglucosamine 2-epimerase (non-hydrolysing)
MKILVPLGTRPEIVKLAPVVAELRRRDHDLRTLATGQHYDPSLADSFFDQLDLHPDARWTLEGSESARLGAILSAAVEEVAAHRADLVLLLGDTNTVPLFSLAARRARIPVAHLEAGLRSRNETSMEEVNRKVAAACCSLHLAPTELAAGFLHAEGVAPTRVRVVGNPVIDVLRRSGIRPRPPAQRAGVVLTAHRATNVDDPVRLAQLVEIVHRLAEQVGPVTFPLHPRTEARLIAAGFYDALAATPGVALAPPLPYDAMLDALAGASLVVTDSGGLQEEASWLGVPVVVLRRSTPRWEGVVNHTSVLVGTDPEAALEAALHLTTPEEQARVANVPCPYGDGHTAQKVADILEEPGIADLLALREPDFTRGALPDFGDPSHGVGARVS